MATQSDLDKINEAIYSGAKRVKYRDREVEYRSIEEMKEARNRIIADMQSTPMQLKTTVPIMEKGI